MIAAKIVTKLSSLVTTANADGKIVSDSMVITTAGHSFL